MKKQFLTFFAVCTLISANAQLKVKPNGNVHVGKGYTFEEVGPIIGGGTLLSSDVNASASDTFMPDSLATMAILGTKYLSSGGYISFGNRGDVSIGESEYSTSGGQKGTMILKGENGIRFEYNGGQALFFYNGSATRPSQKNTFIFNVPVASSEFLTQSDSRLKNNIESLEDAGAGLLDLTPVKYRLNSETLSTDGISTMSAGGNEAPTHFGFIAQEVREIYPELVREDAEGMLSINYDGFIPLLVDVVKDLKAQVANQQKVIEDLTSAPNRQRTNMASVSDIEDSQVISLSQNRPNPFRDNTVIRCQLPESTGHAMLCIYDLNGRQQQQIIIEERGDVTVTVSGKSLAAGMYIYTLIADGQEIDSKRMILTD